jgi:hypothetical protein
MASISVASFMPAGERLPAGPVCGRDHSGGVVARSGLIESAWVRKVPIS